VRILDLGHLPYSVALKRQLETLEAVQSGGEDVLILVEHDPVLTLGANFHAENLLFSVDHYASLGIDVVRTDRGGDVTYF
jgi:lipoyl(octanoyl) transferase